MYDPAALVFRLPVTAGLAGGETAGPLART